MKLSNRIKNLRTIKGYTQKELARLLNVGQTTVANYERGIRVPDAEKLSKIASLFGVTVDYLIAGENNSLSRETTDHDIIESEDLKKAYKVFLDLLIDGYKMEAESYINTLYHRGVDINVIYFDVLEKALIEVGAYWDKGAIDVWKEHYISEVVIDMIRSLKAKERKRRLRTRSVLALTPGPEQHNIGIKMISVLLELDGFDVFYLGSNVPVQSLIQATEIQKPDIITLSVTMPYHIESTKNTIEAVKAYFGANTPKIIVGGRAFLNCQDVCAITGADYYGPTYEDIVRIVKE